jgi:hypothetical protein
LLSAHTLLEDKELLAVRDGAESLRGSQRMGDGQIFLKISAPLSLITIYQINPIPAGSISLDNKYLRVY